ncbi:MAG: hypothetical protein MSL09_08895 [Spirochaetia bacterium]|nr:hypothetical protein [Spirochaetia bacterium]
MTGNELIEKAKCTEPNESLITKIETKYGKIEDSFVKQLLSVRLDDNFLDSEDILRFLTISEILSADENLSVSFSLKNTIPMFDIGDNDFIIYQLNSKKWACMNIIDGTIFSEKETLEELFE